MKTSVSEFETLIYDLEQNATVNKMKDFTQHNGTSCYQHCKNVAYYTYNICKKLNLDYVAAARGAMLHDLFLYDWRTCRFTNGIHGLKHPKIALANASSEFNLSKKEKDVIAKHMWPATIIFPRYIESLVVSLVDKYCAVKEYFSKDTVLAFKAIA